MTKTSKLSRLFKFTWISNKKPCKDWDTTLNIILDMPITNLSEYKATFGGKYDIWISNHPYASGYLYSVYGDTKHPATEDEALPFMSTRIRLEDIVNDHLSKGKYAYSDLLKS